MLKTEDEARQSWCPQSRVAQSGECDIRTTYNRTMTKRFVAAVGITKKEIEKKDPTGAASIADMAPIYALESTFGLSGASSCVASNCMMWRWEDAATPTRGYCGLAGKVEA